MKIVLTLFVTACLLGVSLSMPGPDPKANPDAKAEADDGGDGGSTDGGESSSGEDDSTSKSDSSGGGSSGGNKMMDMMKKLLQPLIDILAKIGINIG